MIKAFGRIRRKSLSESKFGQYLIYALGEIVLVVIGILIALQINKNNDFQKDRRTEKQLIQNLINDLQKDQENLDICTFYSSQNMAKLDTLLQEASFNAVNYEAQDFIRHNAIFSLMSEFLVSKGAYIESLSSGKLSLVQSDSIRDEVLHYYKVEVLALGADELMKNSLQWFITEWADIMSHSSEYSMAFGFNSDIPKKSIREICNHPKYKKLIMQKFGFIRAQIIQWKRLKEINLELINSLEVELERLEG